MSTIHRPFTFKLSILVLVLIVLSGCTTLEPVDLPYEIAPQAAESEHWKEVSSYLEEDRFVLLNEGQSALGWRLRAIDSASKSIDLQTFLWAPDTVGKAVMNRLLVAADRGVKVRILVDDFFIASYGYDELFLQLDYHENIAVRLFNPYAHRADNVAALMALNLGELHRVDHRMHNKVMVVDNRAAIVGGRNLADEYFGLHTLANFRDLELLVTGPGTPQISSDFDRYWNNPWSMPIESLLDVEELNQALIQEIDAEVVSYLEDEESAEERLRQWKVLLQSSVTGSVMLLSDRPPERRFSDEDKGAAEVADAIIRLFEQAKEEVIIISAYLIPTERLENIIYKTISRGVRVRILTNSISSNNHIAAHSAYSKHVKTLLEYGAEMHELRSDAQSRNIYMLTPTESKALSLHAKALIIDQDKVFIGSANLDPRSLRINTEVGLLVESELLNRQARNAVSPDFGHFNSWELKVADTGHVVWVSGDQILEVQPANTFMQRIEDWLLRVIPEDGL